MEILFDGYTTSLSYDAGGRLETVTYPTGFEVSYDYTPTGYLEEINNNATGASLWHAIERDAEGQVKAAELGNGLTEYTDRDVLGRVTGRSLSNGSQGVRLDLAMTYSAGGRPHAIATARGGQTFSYDDNGNVLFDGDRNYAWTSFKGSGQRQPGSGRGRMKVQ